MSVVFVLGGHGSGKSTAVRAIMDNMTPVSMPRRRHPVGYCDDNVFVLGHYGHIPNGGGDTVRPLRRLRTVCHKWAATHHVVLEGIGQAGIADSVIGLLAKHGGAAVHLTTPLDVCINSVRARGHTLSDVGIRRGYTRAAGIAAKIRQAGHDIHEVSREEVVETLRFLTK